MYLVRWSTLITHVTPKSANCYAIREIRSQTFTGPVNAVRLKGEYSLILDIKVNKVWVEGCSRCTPLPLKEGRCLR